MTSSVDDRVRPLPVPAPIASWLNRVGPATPRETLAVAVSSFALFLAAWMIVAGRPPWGDEEHYLQTVRLFGNGLGVELLRTYEEMTAPLSFIVYAAWGHIAGFETASLRLLSVVLATATTVLLWRLTTARAARRLESLLCLFVLIANPYFLGLGVFVFTDMLALLGLAAALVGFQRGSVAVTILGVAIAVLTRQYMAFVAPAMMIAALVRHDLAIRKRTGLALAALAGLFTLAPLIVLWGHQLSPANSLRPVYTSQGFGYSASALSLYLSAPGAYLLPMLVWVARGKDRNHVALAIAGAAAVFVLLCPPQASIVQLDEGSTTVGFLHRGLRSMFPRPIEIAVFALLALLWVGVSANEVLRQRRGTLFLERTFVFWCVVAAFLLVMPFSYMPWEKYAVPLFVASALSLLER